MIADATVIDRLSPLSGAAAELLLESPNPQRALGPDVHTGVLDILLRCAPCRGEAFVVFELLSSLLPGSYDPGPDTVDDVVDTLGRFEVSDVVCHRAFGPNWRAVIAHAYAVSECIDDNGATTASIATDSHRRFGAWVHARETASEAGRLDHWYRAQGAAWAPRFGQLASAPGSDHISLEVIVAIRDVAAALAIADLVGRDGFTEDHFETLVAPGRVLPQPHVPRHVQAGAGYSASNRQMA
ncbi:hypothetical protein ACWDTI_14505 [Gordonia sp. NPDC003424]